MLKSMKQKFGGMKKEVGKSREDSGLSSSSAAKSSSSGLMKNSPGSSSSSSTPREKPPLPVISDQTLAAYYAEPLPSMRDVSAAERQNLFVQKLHLCAFTFDFTDSDKDVREKEVKRQTLLELVDYANSGAGKFTEAVSEDIVFMLNRNLFRSLPPVNPNGVDNYDAEEEEPSLEPAWPHLQIVFEFLLRYVVSNDTDAKVAKKYIDQKFVLDLLELFDSEDPRERGYLKTILHRIYGKFMVHRPFIRKAINNVFYQFIYETEKHNGVTELLEILGSIINGFALPLKEEHKMFLMRALMPLHKPKCVALYHQQLAYCVTQFVEKDAKLAELVITALLKYWPVTNSQKEVLFLGELEEILELTQAAEFQKVMIPLFKQLSNCLNSQHFQVAERSLFLWNNEHIENLVAQQRHQLLPLVLPALEDNTASHWNPAVHGLTCNVRKMFQELDEALFEECQRKDNDDLMGKAQEMEECKRKYDDDLMGKAQEMEAKEKKWEAVNRLAHAKAPSLAESQLPRYLVRECKAAPVH
eukprot:gene19060-25664_t